MKDYSLEFILSVYDMQEEAIRNLLVEFGEDILLSPLENAEGGASRDFKVNLRTEEPTAVFDACAQFGRIKSIKIDQGV